MEVSGLNLKKCPSGRYDAFHIVHIHISESSSDSETSSPSSLSRNKPQNTTQKANDLFMEIVRNGGSSLETRKDLNWRSLNRKLHLQLHLQLYRPSRESYQGTNIDRLVYLYLFFEVLTGSLKTKIFLKIYIKFEIFGGYYSLFICFTCMHELVFIMQT